MKRQKYVDLAENESEQCPAKSPNGRRCAYAAGHLESERPDYHCDAHGIESWRGDTKFAEAPAP